MLSTTNKEAIIKKVLIPSEIDQNKQLFDYFLNHNKTLLQDLGMPYSRADIIEGIYQHFKYTYPFSVAAVQIRLKLGNYKTITSTQLSKKMGQEIKRFKDTEDGSIPLLHFVSRYPQLSEVAFNNKSFIAFYFGSYKNPELHSGPDLIADICLNSQIWWNESQIKRSSDKDVNRKLNAFIESPLFNQVILAYQNTNLNFKRLADVFTKVGIFVNIEDSVTQPLLIKRSALKQLRVKNHDSRKTKNHFFHHRKHSHPKPEKRDQTPSFLTFPFENPRKNHSSNIHPLFYLKM